MNVLCIGGRVVGPELASALIKSFLEAHYIGNEPGGERLARRVEKIHKMENGESIS
jgi:ribose 5-phosphate isomerase B